MWEEERWPGYETMWIAFSTVHVILELILYMLDEIWE